MNEKKSCFFLFIKAILKRSIRQAQITWETDKMACKGKCKKGAMSDKQREVLEAFAKCDTACGGKDIAPATSLEPKQVSCQITALKKKGYVSSPARCKYEITAEGKKALKETGC
jgi:DNA-binding MarR family transcriptional regulator